MKARNENHSHAFRFNSIWTSNNNMYNSDDDDDDDDGNNNDNGGDGDDDFDSGSIAAAGEICVGAKNSSKHSHVQLYTRK